MTGGGAQLFRRGELIPGTVYEVLGVLGSGGMGRVYQVVHTELGRSFVLKALHGHLASRADLVGRLRNEWRALGRLHHENIVQVTDAGQTRDGLPFYVMESMEGETLDAMLAARGRLPVHESIGIICGVLSGLGAAHKTGAIHRDIKPPNIFVTRRGIPKVLDFGIAKLRDRAARVVTAGGVSIGTPRYMAPEQAEGTRVDGRADIYSVALVLYEMLVGHDPFVAIREANELVMAHISNEPERADSICADVPPELGDLLQRWLAKNPADRPPTAELACRELRALGAALKQGQDEPVDTVPALGIHEVPTAGAPLSEQAFSPPLQVAPAGFVAAQKEGRSRGPDQIQTRQWPREVAGAVAAIAPVAGAVAAVAAVAPVVVPLSSAPVSALRTRGQAASPRRDLPTPLGRQASVLWVLGVALLSFALTRGISALF